MSDTTFEVRVQRGERWIIHSTFDVEKEAVNEAEKLLKTKVSAVRVVRDWERADGRHIEKVLLEKQGAGEDDDKDVRVSAIEDAPLCDSDNDLLQSESRATINRLLRKYFEQEILTPCEVMYNYQNLRKLMFHDTLMPTAVDKVAGIHAKATDGDHIEAMNKLHGAIEQLAARAREVEKVDLPAFEDATISEVRDEIRRLNLAEDTDFLTMVALTRVLSSSRNWVGKLDLALKVKGDEKDEAARKLLDDVIADILGSPVALKELLGSSRSFGDAVILHIDLALGRARGNRGSADDILELLNPLFGSGLLATSQEALFDYIVRELRSANSLTRHESDPDPLVGILDRLVSEKGVVYGAPMVSALAERGARLRNVGGPRAMIDGVAEINGRMGPNCRKMAWLLAVMNSGIVEDFGDEVFDMLMDTVKDMRALRAFCDSDAKPRDKMATVTVMNDALQASKLSDEQKQRIGDKLDEGLADYLVREKVIERIDNPSLHLRKRAYMLVQFCSSGVLIEGKSASMARKRVVGYLKQPNFTDKLVDDIKDMTAKEGTIRDFYALLQRSGF
ncbi:hypothetical protein AUP42_12130 [Thalassospira lucentensis]|uniref:Uncharacterized protein n=2 Tax=Thalassospira TaxID=168934 RepID=A0A154LAE3_9PROT|nr:MULTISPECIES: hypothetical protein [Thalassospira]KZB68199.1 hypothetical protein AUP42_12130 [Thalassospira lucentensis]MCH2274348.1 hypothetical protein [Thalassospira sp.]RCK06470.1 hypothetical protein TH5_08215 [Thalassospira xianhensis MCCC 1A02616]